MDAPRLPPVTAGRSALPAFLGVEAWARERTRAGHEAAATTRAEARAEAERIKTEGERALEQAVLDGEREALRSVEVRQRDRISEARAAVEAWIRSAEAASERALDAALALLTAAPGDSEADAGSEG